MNLWRPSQSFAALKVLAEALTFCQASVVLLVSFCFLVHSFTLLGKSDPDLEETCSCGVRNPEGVSKIVGGAATEAGKFPWRVFISVNNSLSSRYGCGGTIISKSWVMTAAHCFDGYGDVDVHVYTALQARPSLGSGIKNTVDRYILHPKYSPDNPLVDHDIALLHLQHSLTFSPNVSSICLPFGMTSFSGIQAWASGWGTTRPVGTGQVPNDRDSSSTLRKVKLPVLSTPECRRYLGRGEVTNNQICTYRVGRGTCLGDSGGSLDYQNTTNSFYYGIGVVSSGNGCAQRNNPGVYTKVTRYLSWIESTTGDSFCRP